MGKYKREAREYLSRDGNYMKMTLGILLCIAVVMMPVALISFIAQVAFYYDADGNNLDFFANAAIIVLTAAATIPSVIGYLGLSASLAKGKNVPLLYMFSPFGNIKKYLASVAFSVFLVALWLVPSGLFALAADIVGKALEAAQLEILFGFVKFLFFAGIFAAILAGLSRLFLVPYYLNCGIPFRQALKDSISATREKPLIIFNYILSFVPLILLSIASVFTFFIVYTIPLMVGSYVAMGKHFDKSKEGQNL